MLLIEDEVKSRSWALKGGVSNNFGLETICESLLILKGVLFSVIKVLLKTKNTLSVATA